MKTLTSPVIGLFVSATITTGALAEGTFQSHYTDCVDKFATNAAGASVTLECTAVAGRLGACKVMDNSAPGKGFDRAAVCVAAFLPMGAKTGVVRVPVRFAAM